MPLKFGTRAANQRPTDTPHVYQVVKVLAYCLVLIDPWLYPCPVHEHDHPLLLIGCNVVVAPSDPLCLFHIY